MNDARDGGPGRCVIISRAATPMREMRTGLAVALLALASPMSAMSPPSMAFNVQPRPSLPGFAALAGGGVGLRVAMTQTRRDRLRGGAHAIGNPGGERVESRRLSAQADWELAPRWTAVAELPYVWNSFTFAGKTESYGALGDAALYGRWAFWRDAPAAPRRELAAVAGVKLPTGSTSLVRGGQRLAATQQPGSGTFDFILGGSASLAAGPAALSFDGSAKFNTGAAYTFGNSLAARAAADLALGPRSRWSLTGEAGVEAAGRDRSVEPGPTVRPDGAVENTGGVTTYLAPGLQWRLFGGTALEASVQLPVYQFVNGVQLAAAPVWRAGLSVRLR